MNDSAYGPVVDDIFNRRQLILKSIAEVIESVECLDFETLLARHPEYTLRSWANVERTSHVLGAPKAGTGMNKVFVFSGKEINDVKTINNILTAIL